MRQWFVGKFRGHYRGLPVRPSELSSYPHAQHFRIEVYEALISQIELGPLQSEPTPDGQEAAPGTNRSAEVLTDHHHDPRGNALHQLHIGRVHLLDCLHPGQVIRSTARDVLMSEIQLSRPAKSAAGSLGHIEGVMSGWFVPPPPPPEIEELPAPEGPPPVGWETRVLSTLGDLKTSQSAEQLPTVVEPGQLDSTSTGAAERKAPSGGMEQQGRKFDSDSVFDRAAEDDEDDLDEALSDEALSEEEPVREYPFFSLGMALSVLLAFFATPFAATLFLITFLFAYGVRRWLLGVVPEVAGIRVLALVLGSLQILVAALLIARWSALGCVTLTPLPLIFLLGTQMVCSLLPRPLPFALTTLGFAAVLLQAYASWAPPTCSELRDVPPVERLTQQMQK